jgi:hypothetical protein
MLVNQSDWFTSRANGEPGAARGATIDFGKGEIMAWWKTLLIQIAHMAIGAGAAVGAAYLSGGHVNPLVGAAVGSALSSLGSANSTPPAQVGK